MRSGREIAVQQPCLTLPKVLRHGPETPSSASNRCMPEKVLLLRGLFDNRYGKALCAEREWQAGSSARWYASFLRDDGAFGLRFLNTQMARKPQSMSPCGDFPQRSSMGAEQTGRQSSQTTSWRNCRITPEHPNVYSPPFGGLLQPRHDPLSLNSPST